MKKSNVIIAVCIVAVCIIGWLTVGSQLIEQSNLYSDYVKEADDCVERGLYQRAIANYNLALEEKETEELYEKINIAYGFRCKEALEETIDDYMDFLKLAVAVYPGNHALVDSFVDLYYMESKYEDIYNCLIRAVENGYDTEDIQSLLRQARYAFNLRRSEFSGIIQSAGEFYTVARNDGWNVYCIKDGYLLTKEYEYVSCANNDGMVVVTGEDSRILDTSGMVYGIFDGKVSDASLYADNLVAACIDGVYSYYNDLAEKQFGEYEMAGTFQNGKAAVKKDGKWMIIDTEGNPVSGTYDEIALDYAGCYLIDDVMLAKVNGVYGLYNEKFKLQCELNYSNTDILTCDKILAVCKDGKWGYVNDVGEIVVENIYDDAKSFSYGLAAVKKDGKWGFIDTDGNLVIDHQFSDVGYMSSDGICPVRTDMPEEKAEHEDGETPEIIETMEIWKMLQLEIGIKEN